MKKKTPTAETTQFVVDIPLSLIQAGDNDRTKFKTADLENLAETMRDGLLQPIILRPVGDTYEIVAGERRFRAAGILGWDQISAIVRVRTDAEASRDMLCENTARVNLNPMDECRAYAKRIASGDWTVDQIARIAGVSEDTVRRRLELAKLIYPVQRLLETGQFPVGHADMMVLLDEERQGIAYRTFIRAPKGMTSFGFKDICDRLKAEQDQGSLFELESFFLQAVEQPSKKRRGKGAVTGAPTNAGIPPVAVNPTDTVASVLDRYIATLMSEGKSLEAATIGTVYEALVHSGLCMVPPNSVLLGTTC